MAQNWHDEQRQKADGLYAEEMAKIRKRELENQRKHEAVGQTDKYVESLERKIRAAIDNDSRINAAWIADLRNILHDRTYAGPALRIQKLQDAVIRLKGVTLVVKQLEQQTLEEQEWEQEWEWKWQRELAWNEESMEYLNQEARETNVELLLPLQEEQNRRYQEERENRLERDKLKQELAQLARDQRLDRDRLQELEAESQMTEEEHWGRTSSEEDIVQRILDETNYDEYEDDFLMG